MLPSPPLTLGGHIDLALSEFNESLRSQFIREGLNYDIQMSIPQQSLSIRYEVKPHFKLSEAVRVRHEKEGKAFWVIGQEVEPLELEKSELCLFEITAKSSRRFEKITTHYQAKLLLRFAGGGDRLCRQRWNE